MSERIVVGLSGGVDSALAAALLQERGFAVTGCFLKVAIPDAPCPWETDLPMAHRVAAHLNVPLIVKDVSAEYEREVLEPMIAAYRRGETPNPDTTCNRYVKFNALAAVAHAVGAERIATGHYVRISKSFSPSHREGERLPAEALAKAGEGVHCSTPGVEQTQGYRYELWRGVDFVKDQSYFLWQLTQEQLSMCEFPIGEWRKDDVRQEAKRRGFPNWNRDSTSGVCFLGEAPLAQFLASRILPERSPFGGLRVNCAESKGNDRPATVVTTAGKIIGTIPNAEALTIGQRIPLAGQPVPRYVVAQVSDCPTPGVGQSRRVVVSTTPDDPARYTKTITTGPPHWIGEQPKFSPPLPLAPTEASGEGERLPAKALLAQRSLGEVGAKAGEGVQSALHCTARIRHRQDPVPCTVSLITRHSSLVTLDTLLTGVAPGQAVVFTDGDRVLGGATITGSDPLRERV